MPGYGCVWQWLNPDGTVVPLLTVSTVPTSSFEITPFASFNFTTDVSQVVPL